MFGKDEADGAKFEFTQELVDEIVEGKKDVLTGALVPLFPTIPAYDLRPLVHLCISGTACLLDRTGCFPRPLTFSLIADANKAMLVRCDALIPTLLDSLFLDPEHPRKDMDETLRAGIQRDGAECFLQLALLEPGRELLEQHPEALDAMQALVDGAALTEEARLSASSALAAIDGPAPGPGPDPGDEKHVMVSCASARLSLAVQLVLTPRFGAVRSMGCASHYQAAGCVAEEAWLRGVVW